MKYPAICLGYLLVWCYLLPWLVIERLIKLLIIIITLIWHFKADLTIFNKYLFIIMPHGSHPIFWEIDNLSDYFMLRNWK